MTNDYEELRRALGAHVIANDERSARHWRVNVLSKCKPELLARLLAERDRLEKAMKDVRWRISDTRETLMSRKGWGDDERVYGCDEWSTPTLNLQRAVDAIDAALSKEPRNER